MSKCTSFVRDESKMHNVPAWVIFTMPLVMLLMVISVIISIISVFSRNYILLISMAVLFALTLFWSIFTDSYFNYHENCKIKFQNNSIQYDFNLNSAVINSSKTTVTVKINDLKKYKIRGNKIKYWGKITKKAPFQHEKYLKSIELPLDFIDRETVIDTIKNYIVRN